MQTGTAGINSQCNNVFQDADLNGIGSAISIVLGMMRANIGIVILAMTIGKILRYALLAWGVELF